MKYKRILALFAVLLLSFTITAAQDQGSMSDLCNVGETTTSEQAPSNDAKAILALTSLETGNLNFVQNFVGETYVQHNVSVPDGRDGILGLVPAMAQSGTKVSIYRVLTMGDLVATQTEFDSPMFGGKFVGFDVYRFEDGVIVEHWDNLMPVSEPNVSGHTETDGPIAVTDLDRTQENCNRVVEFLTRALITHDPDLDITQYISPTTYIQHNPGAGDGLDAFMGMMQAMAQNNMVMGFTQIHFVVAQGNFVLTVSEGVLGDAANPAPTAFYDLFRLEDGLIVEHWDVISPIPPQSEWQNQNGKF